MKEFEKRQKEMKSLMYGSLQDESTYFLSLLTIHQGEFSYTERNKKNRSNNLTLQSLKAWSQILHNIKTTNSSSDAIGFHGPEKQMKYYPMLSEQCCAMTEVNKWFDMKMQQKTSGKSKYVHGYRWIWWL